MAKCKLCNKSFKIITNTHLASTHNLTLKGYVKRFGNKDCGFAISPSLLPKEDERYISWRESLKKRPPPWSKGYTKDTHSSVAKISKTFKRKKIDNFSNWRKQNQKEYPDLEKNENLAFLVGIILGDGNLQQLPRTEQLRITLGTDKPSLWKYTAKVLERVFKKKPYVYKVKNSACVVIGVYQKKLSDRLGIPKGNRNKITIKIPPWISKEDKYLRECLRGLYEAEGSLCTHKPTYTYKMIFSNYNDSLLDAVYNALVRFGFHPHKSPDKIQLSRKEEVYKFKDFISFRKYK